MSADAGYLRKVLVVWMISQSRLDSFGKSLAAGDFNDGRDDSAVGTSSADFGAGIVQVIYGSDLGL